MTRKAKRVLMAVEPWAASGPGWSNSGVTLRYRLWDGSEATETRYRHELPTAASILFPVALTAYNALLRALEN